jgi:AcrR family transcriptional regulator
VPRDATETRSRLLDEAERLFATKGVHQTTAREIMEAANQRNASALTYHFGSRTGILVEILRRHGDPLDEERGLLAPDHIEEAGTRELVAALLLPYGGCLRTPDGRNYVRIVAQLSEMFTSWREGDVIAKNLDRILDELETRVPADEPVCRQRIVSAISLMTSVIGERARQIDHGLLVELDDASFLSDLADVIVAMLEAPVGPPLSCRRP